MPYNSVISRTDAAALIPEEAARDIIQAMPEASAVMALGRRLPDVARNQLRMAVMSALATAYFVDAGGGESYDDTALKQTTEINWTNKYINIGELACIVPIPQAVLDDADYDIWAEIKPQIAEAFGKTFDAAVFYGTGAPGTWPTGIVTAAGTASNSVTIGTVGTDLYDDIMAEAGVISKVEDDGYFVNGHVGSISMRAKLRSVRDDNQQPIFKRSMQDGTRYELDGEPMIFPRNGAVVAATSLLISGDWNALVWAVRQDITYKVLTEAVIQNTAGAIQYNLAQQDMVALRCVMRLGWQVPNPINRIEGTEGDRYPFAVLVPAP